MTVSRTFGNFICCNAILFSIQDGQTALSIAENLGHKAVVDLLKNITDVMVSPATKKRKVNLAVPETMQEAAMSDLEDEGCLTVTSAVSACVHLK